jgi:hypothetical protein
LPHPYWRSAGPRALGGMLVVTWKHTDFKGFYFKNEAEGDTRCLPSGVMVSVDMMMLRNRSGVERLGAPLAEAL